jgi:ribosome-associated protein
MPIPINDQISIPDGDIQLDFVQASGPGGQNVNKVASKAQLRFNVWSGALPEDARKRLFNIAGKRINAAGMLVIEAGRYRTQERNRQEAVDRLVGLIRQATEAPKSRRKTRPTAGSKLRRLAGKRRRSETKRLRRRVSSIEE